LSRHRKRFVILNAKEFKDMLLFLCSIFFYTFIKTDECLTLKGWGFGEARRQGRRGVWH